jgi:hypothetical protein
MWSLPYNRSEPIFLSSELNRIETKQLSSDFGTVLSNDASLKLGCRSAGRIIVENPLPVPATSRGSTSGSIR